MPMSEHDCPLCPPGVPTPFHDPRIITHNDMLHIKTRGAKVSNSEQLLARHLKKKKGGSGILQNSGTAFLKENPLLFRRSVCDPRDFALSVYLKSGVISPATETLTAVCVSVTLSRSILLRRCLNKNYTVRRYVVYNDTIRCLVCFADCHSFLAMLFFFNLVRTCFSCRAICSTEEM